MVDSSEQHRENEGMSNAALEQLVDEVRDLPLTVSDVLAQVITECDNADASVSSLARIMAGDQALAAMVLKLANSAYYGYARRIESLPDAVVLLGFSSVKNLAITASITRLLATDQDDLTEIRSGIFEHSLATAVCARILGRTRRVMGEKAFVAGLLHDLGLIVLVCYAKDRFRELHALAVARDVPFEDIELEVLGFTSAALGSAVAAEWQFPPGLCDALAHQHDPSAAEADPLLARTVHLADWLAKKLAIGFIGPAPRESPDAEAAAEFQITPASLARFESEAAIEFEEGQSLRALGKAA
jgi:HD-like signal output (HDOD) protein